MNALRETSLGRLVIQCRLTLKLAIATALCLIASVVAFAVAQGARGTITTVAGGCSGPGNLATNACLGNLYGVATDPSGNLFIAAAGNRRVFRVDASTGVMSTVAGTEDWGFTGDEGLATSARLNWPTSVALDSDGNIFIADTMNNRIRRVDASTGVIITVAGNGEYSYWGDGRLAIIASLAHPYGVTVDLYGNLFIADSENHRVRRVDAITSVIKTVAGTGEDGYSGDGSVATSAKISNPYSVIVDLSGNLFIADYYNHRVRRVDSITGIITTIAGNGVAGFSGDGSIATNASLNNPRGLALDLAGNLFIADDTGARVRRIDSVTGIITTVAGNGIAGFSGDGGPAIYASLDLPSGVAVDSSGNLFIGDDTNGRIRRVEGIAAVTPNPSTTPVPSISLWVIILLAGAFTLLVLWRSFFKSSL